MQDPRSGIGPDVEAAVRHLTRLQPDTGDAADLLTRIEVVDDVTSRGTWPRWPATA